MARRNRVSFDQAKDRLRVPKGREKEFEAYMDSIAALYNPAVIDAATAEPAVMVDGKTYKGRDPHRPVSVLVPPNWRETTALRNPSVGPLREEVFDSDYDFVAAFLAGAEPGINPEDGAWHMTDVGKMPTHKTFSVESYYARDPKWAPYAGRWDGETYIPPDPQETRQDAKGGDSGEETPVSETPVPEPGPQPQGGPRIVINPSTFRNQKDALCVAFNEAFRIVMEDTGFEPQMEPTEAQRRFFSDTAYADDELQLRRTILARICTFDTSVEDPTDGQLQEAVEFLETVMEVGAPQNEWERQAVQRLHDMVAKVLEDGEGDSSAPPPPSPSGDSVQADEGGGGALEDIERKKKREQAEREQAEKARQEQEQKQKETEQADAFQEKRRNAAVQLQQAVQGPLRTFSTGELSQQLAQPAGQPDLSTRAGRDTARLMRSGESDRRTLLGELLTDVGRYGSGPGPYGTDGKANQEVMPGMLQAAAGTMLTEDRAKIETAARERTADYAARKSAVEVRQAGNHYVSEYTRTREAAVSQRKASSHYVSDYARKLKKSRADETI